MSGFNDFKLDFPIPPFLEKEIDELRMGIQNDVSYIDCLQNEIYGSINAALNSKLLTEEQAQALRSHYVFTNYHK